MRSRVQVKTGMKKTAIIIRSSFLSVLHSGVKKYNATNAAASVASAPKNIDRAKFGFRLMSMALRVKCGPSLLHVGDVEFADVDEMASEGGRGGHDGADEVRAAVAALATFKIAIGSAGAALVRRENVGVHADAHAAARVAPLETGVGEDFVEAFFFGGGFDSARAGNDERLLDGLRDVLSFDEVRGGAQIVEPRIGARTDEDAVHGNIRDRRAGFEPHVFQSAFGGFLIVQILEVVRIGHARVHAGDHAGIRPPRTCGAICSACNSTVMSNFAPSSECNCFQRATASSNSFPRGTNGRPSRYLNVVSSGATIPARAPPSIVILQTVMRPSMESSRMACPPYSATWPVPPPMPIFPMMARMMSFAVTPFGRFPCTRMCIVLDFDCTRHCVASTCSTSLVPMPKASVPKAPCVEVWLSPQTIVLPGCVMPSSGPMTCTMP